MSIPKHKFISWLAMRGRLHTADKVDVYDNNSPTDCLLCGVMAETQGHIISMLLQ